MTLSDELAEAPEFKIRVLCTVAAIGTRLSGKDRKAFLNAANGKPAKNGIVWQAKDLADKMSERGFPVSAGSIQRHRRGECKCPKA